MKVRGSVPGGIDGYPNGCGFTVNVTKLPAEKVENGEIYQRILFDEEGLTVSILYLGPKAKVAEHMHTTDMEIYVAWHRARFRFEICKKGNSHSLQNTANKEWLVVMSVKIRK